MNWEFSVERGIENDPVKVAWLDDPSLQDKYKVPNWVKSCRPDLDDFKMGSLSKGRGYDPFDFEMDPGFSGGRDRLEARYRSEAMLEHRLLQGDSYMDACKAAGVKGAYFPEEEREVRQEAKYNQALREGKSYQDARLAAGMGRDCDPGFAGGEEAIVWRDRAYAWLKEYLRQGKDLTTAEFMALSKIGPAPGRR